MHWKINNTILELRQSAEILRRAANDYNDPLIGDVAFVCGTAAELLKQLENAEWSQRALLVVSDFVKENDPELYERIKKLKIK